MRKDGRESSRSMVQPGGRWNWFTYRPSRAYNRYQPCGAGLGAVRSLHAPDNPRIRFTRSAMDQGRTSPTCVPAEPPRCGQAALEAKPGSISFTSMPRTTCLDPAGISSRRRSTTPAPMNMAAALENRVRLFREVLEDTVKEAVGRPLRRCGPARGCMSSNPAARRHRGVRRRP